MGTRNKKAVVKLITIVMVMCYLEICIGQLSSDGDCLVVIKNDKLSVLNCETIENHQIGQYDHMNRMWVYNDPQSITLEVPVDGDIQLNLNETINLTQHLPLWNDLIKSKGYIKPSNPFQSQNNQMLKGYRYTKPHYHDTAVHQIYEQIQAFIKSFLQVNNLTSLNLRMEDTFMVQIIIDEQQKNIANYVLGGIRLKYLFATLTKDQIPERFLKTTNQNSTKNQHINIITHTKYAQQNKFNTLERKLYGRGLHQSINHTIILNDLVDIQLQSLANQCWYEFTDILPESTYIDSDQKRQQTANYETINIEKPAFASKQYFYKYRVPLIEIKQSGVHKYSYHQPIHFRYPSPSLLNYTKVYLHPIVEARIICKNQQHSQDIHQKNEIIYKLQENLLYERGTASIPNADISKTRIVSTTTLVVCLVAALVIIKNLKQN